MPTLRPRYSIVAPVYNEEDGLAEFYRRTSAVMDSLDGPGELVLIFDGSRDRSPEIGRELQASDPRVRLIEFSRNFGHQIAITAGIDQAEATPSSSSTRTCRTHRRSSRSSSRSGKRATRWS